MYVVHSNLQYFNWIVECPFALILVLVFGFIRLRSVRFLQPLLQLFDLELELLLALFVVRLQS